MSGSLAVVLALVGIPLVTLLAPWFAWPANALSDLGVAPRTAALFNGTLLVAAALGLPYAWALWRDATGWARASGVLFAPTLLLLGGVGAFPSGSPYHFPAAVGFYLGLTATLVADGLTRHGTATGRASLAFAALHVGQWALWVAGVRVGPGLAVPEFVGAAVLALWVLALSPVAPLAGGGESRTGESDRG
ncbi:hypothetical protein K933_12977 [Candidatus Halobonum tyrrellensis G22]|uniref:DUF998 domain-containing protein n=1 Tax=Candidatus Halobonum tyrrellensis G22 TaxID=1324957 RepID=V4IWR3_9EURY|nr:hypothetical protein K933_12977 [Candidatus Halobonum tyrrellensis G22]